MTRRHAVLLASALVLGLVATPEGRGGAEGRAAS